MEPINCSTGEKCYTLNEYLKSVHWKNKKKAFKKKIKKHECSICNTEHVKLEIHHKTYERLGNEMFGDLVLVCEKCYNELYLIINNPEYKNKKISSIWNIVRKIRKRKIISEKKRLNKSYKTSKPKDKYRKEGSINVTRKNATILRKKTQE